MSERKPPSHISPGALPSRRRTAIGTAPTSIVSLMSSMAGRLLTRLRCDEKHLPPRLDNTKANFVVLLCSFPSYVRYDERTGKSGERHAGGNRRRASRHAEQAEPSAAREDWAWRVHLVEAE